jgi:predicted GNAT family acetyltransferase
MTDAIATVFDRPDENRYEIIVGDQIAFLAYRRRDDQWILVHTEVPEGLRGQGLGQILARHALDDARRSGVHVIVKCPFVTAWLRRHNEYDDIIVARVAESGQVDRQTPDEPR